MRFSVLTMTKIEEVVGKASPKGAGDLERPVNLCPDQ